MDDKVDMLHLILFTETCLLLALYMYITSRPDKLASERLWLRLEQEVKVYCMCKGKNTTVYLNRRD